MSSESPYHTAPPMEIAQFMLSNPKTFDFLQALDRIDNDFGCITNLVKDSRLPASVIASQYSQLDIFRSTLGNYDPGFNFQNTISNKIFDA